MRPRLSRAESVRLRAVQDGNALALQYLEFLVGKPLARADCLYYQAAPEAQYALVPERLPAVGEYPTDALLLHPLHRGVGLRDQNLRQLGVGQPFGYAHEVVVELRLGVASDVDGLALFFADFGDDAEYVLDAVVCEAEQPAGEEGVAAAQVFGGAFKDEDGRALVCRRHRGAKGGVAGARYYYVVSLVHRHVCLSDLLSYLSSEPEQDIDRECAPFYVGNIVEGGNDFLGFVNEINDFIALESSLRVVVGIMTLLLHDYELLAKCFYFRRKPTHHRAIAALVSGKAMLQSPVCLIPCRLAATAASRADHHIGAAAGECMEQRIVRRAHGAPQFGLARTTYAASGRPCRQLSGD